MHTQDGDIEEGRITANGLEFAYLAAGPDDGPLALCLHGFPDTAWTYRHLLPQLAASGFRAVAPYMRGYAPTAVPGDGLYQTGALVADSCGLHDALGGDERAVIIGHDWGASATYGAAVHAPDRWRRVVTMAVPPAGTMSTGFLRYDQLKRSFYIFVFQTPFADMAVPADDFAFIDCLWRDWSPGYDGAADAARVKEALRDPANTAAAIGYYRALFDPAKHSPTLAVEQAATGGTPPQPSLYLHGRDDGCLGADLADGAEKFMSPGSRAVMIDGAGHFLHVERPTEVNRLIVDWVTG